MFCLAYLVGLLGVLVGILGLFGIGMLCFVHLVFVGMVYKVTDKLEKHKKMRIVKPPFQYMGKLPRKSPR